MREPEIEKIFVWNVVQMGGQAFKFKSVNCRGVSDQVVMLPDGSTHFVELKAPKGRLSPLQEIFRDNCKRLNQNYACLYSVEQINNWRNNHEGKSAGRNQVP